MTRTIRRATNGSTARRPAVRRSWLLILIVLLLTLPAAACGSTDRESAAGTDGNSEQPTSLSISGAFALFPMVSLWASEYSNTGAPVRFDIQAGGAGKGMTDVLSGAADIAMLSREPRPEELAQDAFVVPVVIDAVVGVVNADNPHLAELQQAGITGQSANAIWIARTTTTWGQLVGSEADDRINVYTRSDASGAAEMWALFAQGKSQEELGGTAVNGDPGLAEAVRQDKLGIGYNNVGFAYDQSTGLPIDGLVIVPIDLNNDGQIGQDEDFYAQRDELTAAVAAETYPFPPARVLYLVTKGQPSPAIVDFYRWILSDGQAFVHSAGYVGLTDARLKAALDLLNAPQ